MHVLIVLLIMIVALGRGGYDPWATLVLELGAAGFALVLVFEVLRKTGSQERRRLLKQRRAWKKLPRKARRRSDVTILPPGSTADEESYDPAPENHFLVLGFPFRRTGLGIPILLLSLWIVSSLVPIKSALLESI